MSTIRIGNAQKRLADADSQWIAQQINGRRHDGENVCVVVTINTPDVTLCLATPACGGGRGGSHHFNPREIELIEFWKKHRLNDDNYSVGSVVAFVGHALQRI